MEGGYSISISEDGIIAVVFVVADATMSCVKDY